MEHPLLVSVPGKRLWQLNSARCSRQRLSAVRWELVFRLLQPDMPWRWVIPTKAVSSNGWRSCVACCPSHPDYVWSALAGQGQDKPKPFNWKASYLSPQRVPQMYNRALTVCLSYLSSESPISTSRCQKGVREVVWMIVSRHCVKDLVKEVILCQFSGSNFYLGVIVEQVYILQCSKNTLFFSYGAFLRHPFMHSVLNAPF